MGRVILHCDANSYYASVECLYKPEIRNMPVAVAGCVEERHGIILTKNQEAKKYGIQTGEAIWQAKQKCPSLICMPPDYALYVRFSKRMRRLYEEYSDRVESFGLDEAWVDISDHGRTIEDGKRIADEIRRRVREEIGLTISVGVANNKIFAKLGSDMKKPDATSVIHPETFQHEIWQLPVSDLLFVGPHTTKKLQQMNVLTIGDLARFNPEWLRKRLGKNGVMLWEFANGLDISPVMPCGVERAIQSIGNSTTPPHDIETIEDAHCLIYLLSESVAARLRENGFRAGCVSIGVRSTDLHCTGTQMHLQRPAAFSGEIAKAALELFDRQFCKELPFRSMGVHCSALTDINGSMQLNLFENEEKQQRMEALEYSIDNLRKRFGHQIVRRGITLIDRGYAAVNPKEDNTIHPVPFFAG